MPITQALTEDQVNELVREAKEDVEECLISPIWAYINYQPWPMAPGALRRQHARAMAVMGVATRGISFLKSTGLVVLIFGVLLAALLVSDEMSWVADLIFALLFAVMFKLLIGINNQFREAHARIDVYEHRDFTDPSQVTGKLSAWVPRLAYYGRPDVWKGDNGRNGIANPASRIVVQTRDEVVWLQDEEKEDDEGNKITVKGGVQATRARKVTDFRVTQDYLDLPAQPFRVTGNASRARRALLRMIQRNGIAIEGFEKGNQSFIERNWEWFYCGACLVITLLLFIFAGD